MTQFAVEIKGTLSARNFDSAQAKLERLKEKVDRVVEASEVRLVGQEKQDDAARVG